MKTQHEIIEKIRILKNIINQPKVQIWITDLKKCLAGNSNNLSKGVNDWLEGKPSIIESY